MRHLVMGTVVAAAVLSAGALSVGAAAPGAVYTATNGAGGNTVYVFDRAGDGSLSLVDMVATGGNGTGAGLGNQGAVRMTRGGRFLLVVNAGSNDVSVFRVTTSGLQLLDVEPSGGVLPISLAVDGNLVYVLNAGGRVGDVDNVTGFRLSPQGDLTAIPGATGGLSGVNTNPAQVEFSPDGAYLVVTEKATNTIDVFSVNPSGTLGGAAAYASVGAVPFGFAFGKRGQFFVTEAAPGAVTSYQLDDFGVPLAVSPTVLSNQNAACWLVVSTSGRYLYETNAASGSISGYTIEPDGTIALLDASGVTANTGAGSLPLDLAFSVSDRYLYSLNAGNGTITGFRVGEHGRLELVDTVVGLPAGLNGLIAQ